jgi:hypothetical protein
MAKHSDKHAMAEDYLAQVEWESSHPLDQRGRPSWKHQPKWIYSRRYPRMGKVSPVLWIMLIAAALTVLGFAIVIASANNPGVGIFGMIVLLSILAILFYLARGGSK